MFVTVCHFNHVEMFSLGDEGTRGEKELGSLLLFNPLWGWSNGSPGLVWWRVAGHQRRSSHTLCRGSARSRNENTEVEQKSEIYPQDDTVQRKSSLSIPFLGLARPQSRFPSSCVWKRFIYCQDRSTYFLQQNRQIDRGNTVYKLLTDTWMWKLGLWPHNSLSGNICF